VRRLPDEPFYHEDKIQTVIIDILFIYCKLNPNSGGYRQGMHELLAPIVFVVEQDSIDRGSLDPEQLDDELMVEMLDLDFIEHDAFALFSKVMDRAQAFYEVMEPASEAVYVATGRDHGQRSAIVDKSKFIHEVCLVKVDPELATHLKSIEILPQIFLMWVPAAPAPNLQYSDRTDEC
jgi:TBC1 domain family member 5